MLVSIIDGACGISCATSIWHVGTRSRHTIYMIVQYYIINYHGWTLQPLLRQTTHLSIQPCEKLLRVSGARKTRQMYDAPLTGLITRL
jgi:hypothetical protein